MQALLGFLLVIAVAAGGAAIGKFIVGSDEAAMIGAGIAFWIMVAVIAKEKTGKY